MSIVPSEVVPDKAKTGGEERCHDGFSSENAPSPKGQNTPVAKITDATPC